jgi:hypothetical protein
MTEAQLKDLLSIIGANIGATEADIGRANGIAKKVNKIIQLPAFALVPDMKIKAL